VNLYVRSENNAWFCAVYGGDAEPYPQLVPSFESGTIAASQIYSGDYLMQPQWTHRFPTPQVVGQGFAVEIVVAAALDDFEIAGYEMEWHDGPFDRFPVARNIE